MTLSPTKNEFLESIPPQNCFSIWETSAKIRSVSSLEMTLKWKSLPRTNPLSWSHELSINIDLWLEMTVLWLQPCLVNMMWEFAHRICASIAGEVFSHRELQEALDDVKGMENARVLLTLPSGVCIHHLPTRPHSRQPGLCKNTGQCKCIRELRVYSKYYLANVTAYIDSNIS